MAKHRLTAATLTCVCAALLPASGRPATPPTKTFAAAGDRAVATLLEVFYAGNGLWADCDAPSCARSNRDWGADSLTYTLHLRWSITHARRLVAPATALIGTAPTYSGACREGCGSWSDVPMWDSIAAMREYEIAGSDRRALAKAKAAFDFVERATVFALGACPQIRYQQPLGGGNKLKTLETDANAIKAALLLYGATRSSDYLRSAVRRYRAVRSFFLDPKVPLYSVYVFDDGRACTQLPRRFFASVNGAMIWNGLELARRTRGATYRRQALATARAVASRLSDSNGVFANLQAENDIAEPLVEAMYRLATEQRSAFARRWILRNAAAALSARTPNGAFGRFFDGPPPRSTVTAWQTNGGLALAIAAAGLAPRARAASASVWQRARLIRREVTNTPASVTIRGSGVAFLGTLGERCCEAGHARVFVDGRETFNHTGIWQNKSSSGRSLPDTVLFAWRWPRRGTHTIRFEAGELNGKEGGPFLHLSGYLLL